MKHEVSEHEKPMEISFGEIFYFFKSAWKTVLVSSIIGFCIAIIVNVVPPKKYEAIALIKMASMSFGLSSPVGTAIEDPLSLVARMQIPTNYDPDVLAACTYEEGSAKPLPESVLFLAPKGLANVVEIKVTAPSQTQAFECAEMIVGQVKKLQMQSAQLFIDEAKAKLDEVNKQIETLRNIIAKYDNYNSTLSMSNLIVRDELNGYLIERIRLLEFINSLKRRGAYITSPIYVVESATSLKKWTSLVIGLLTGALLGVLVAFMHHLRKNKFY